MRLLFASLVGFCAFWQDCARPAADVLAGGIGLKGGVISLYSGTEEGPATVVRLDQAYADYESKGFFRIGLLPIGVMEGVTFELPHRESLTNSLAQLHRWLGARAAKRLELRRVTFLVSAPVTNRLAAGRARVSLDGTLQLLDGVNFISGTNQLQAGRGVLQVTGEQAGQLILETSPPWTNSLFGCIAIPEPTSHAKLQ